jgi:hypothetical protein
MSWLVLEVLLIQSSSELTHLRLFPPQLLLQAPLTLPRAALHGLLTITTPNRKYRVSTGVNRLEIQSVMLVYSTRLYEQTFSLGLHPPSLCE